MQNKIRPLALCVFLYQNKILVAEGHDPEKNQTFYRPLGGGIEFGERSDETVRREIMEELNAEVSDLKYLGTFENIFVFNGQPGHEIIQIYDGRLVNSGLYEQAEMFGHEAGAGEFKVVWKRLDEFNQHAPLYPDGLLELLVQNFPQ
ncbi:MAG: NUDIX hydrolase [Chloroflexi bacterium]|nr:NUDIX hydrolase [Chloroflexota bacterium]